MSDRRYQHSQKWKGKGRQPARHRRPHPHPTRTSNHISETSSSTTAPSSRNNIESASYSSQPAANQPPDLPGFYYDPDKKRYFKILTARHGFKENPYSIDNIRIKSRIQDEEKSISIRPKKPSKVSEQRTMPIGNGELNLRSLTHLLRARELGMQESTNFFAYISDVTPVDTEIQYQGTKVHSEHEFRPPDEPPPKKLRLNYENLSFQKYRNDIGYGGFKSGYADTNLFIRTVLDNRLRKVDYHPIDIPASPFVDLKAHPSSDYYFLATRNGGVRIM
ncbi:hypothetical protein BKA69DRAFT_127597 [Paraphysoderma sedebokerense]|nr:hypothetical protein BKA69DRAFT_127597 [Paraphysoderma sedebokerense]